MITIKDAWGGYLHSVVSKKAGPVQITETKAAFYGGALVMMGLTLETARIEDIDEAEKAYSKLNDEVTTYAKEIINEPDSNSKK